MTDSSLKPHASSLKPALSKQGKVLVRLLKDRPHAWGAEIGVNHGTTQCQLLAHLPNLERLYAVDPWLAYPGYRQALTNAKWRTQEKFDGVYRAYLQRIQPWAGKVFILRLFSVDAARAIPDASLNWVFIDPNHDYEHAVEDIACWTPKVMPGGLVMGHDFLNRPEWGVIRAVREAFPGRFHKEPHYVWWVEV